MNKLNIDDLINKIHVGNALEVLNQFPDGCIDMVVTSPPYWAKRDYSDSSVQIWGDDKDCEHVWGNDIESPGTRKGEKDPKEYGSKEVSGSRSNFTKSSYCSKCNSWRGQLGLEPDPDLYVSNLIQIFGEVKRVLKDKGTLWIVIGDTYVSAKSRYSSSPHTISGGHHRDEPTERNKPDLRGHEYLKDKDLAGIPWRVAFALQRDGWWLRNDNIWNKSNNMPECLCPETKVYIKHNGVIKHKDLDWIYKNENLLGDIKIMSPNGWKNINDIWKIVKNKYIEINAKNVEKNIICSENHRFAVSHDKRRKNVDYLEAFKIRDDGYNDYFLYQTIDKYLDVEKSRLDLVKIANEMGCDAWVETSCEKSRGLYKDVPKVEIAQRYGYKMSKKKYNSKRWTYTGRLVTCLQKGLIPVNIVIGEKVSYDEEYIRVCNTMDKWPTIIDVNYEFGFFLGLYTAEGGFADRRGYRCKLTFNSKEKDLIKRCNDWLKKYNINSNIIEHGSYTDVTFSSGIISMIVDYFIPGKCKVKELKVNKIVNFCKEFREGIVDGYVAGDGTDRSGGGFSVSSASEKLIDSFSDVCSSVGIVTSKSHVIQYRNGTKCESWRLITPFINRKSKKGTSMVQILPKYKRLIKGDKEFIDIDVEDDLFLIGNGLVSHNSTKDRCTTSHEYVFMLTKSKFYYFDQDRVREPYTEDLNRWGGDTLKADGVSTWDEGTGQSTYRNRDMRPNSHGKNRRTVWNIPTVPFSGEHYATFAPDLIEIPIKAGCPEYVCKKCGTAREKIYGEREIILSEKPATGKHKDSPVNSPGNREHYISEQRKYHVNQKSIAEFIKPYIKGSESQLTAEFGEHTWPHWIRTDDSGASLPNPEQYRRLKDICDIPDDYDKEMLTTVKVSVDDKGSKNAFLGYSDCGCGEGFEPGIVLDPFIGSGTTAMVSEQFGMRWIGIEINEDYKKLAIKRINHGDEYIRKEVKVKRLVDEAKKECIEIDKFME